MLKRVKGYRVIQQMWRRRLTRVRSQGRCDDNLTADLGAMFVMGIAITMFHDTQAEYRTFCLYVLVSISSYDSRFSQIVNT
jgi:hypothetical protein